jgi:hypothetical protein
MGFFRSVIMPLLPKESKVAVDREGVITWRSLISGEAAGNVDCRLPIAECGEEARGATDRPGVVP